MTDTKPTLAEQIEHQIGICYGTPSKYERAKLASLEELQSIKSQPVPVEPELIPECSYCGLTQAVTLKSYDSLKQQLQVAQQERDGYLDLNRDCAELALNHLERAEKAEAELASLRLELARLDGEIPYGN